MEIVLIILLRLQDITCKSEFNVSKSELVSRFLGPQPPPLYLVHNLPPLFVAREYLAFNRAHADWLEKKDLVDGNGAYREWILENNALWRLWDDVDSAVNVNYTVWTRRNALGRVIRTLDDDFYTRTFPPAAPLWRFQND